MPRIFPDTNVLFPFSVMDLLLALSEDGVHEVVWTEALPAEWQEVIVREQRRSAETAAAVAAAVREFFDDTEIRRDDYEHLLGEMPGPDPDDHEHMAAAVAGAPCVLLTRDVDGFPSAPLQVHGVEVLDPDTYLCRLIDALPSEVVATTRLAAEKENPPKAPEDLIDDLERAGVAQFAAKAREALGG